MSTKLFAEYFIVGLPYVMAAVFVLGAGFRAERPASSLLARLATFREAVRRGETDWPTALRWVLWL